MDDATTRDMVKKVIHKLAYARRHQDLVVAMERVQRIATESKVAQAEIELVHLKSRQVEMEESYLVAIELMKNKADRTRVVLDSRRQDPRVARPAARGVPACHQEGLFTEAMIFAEDYPRKDQMCKLWKKPRCYEV